MNVLFSCFSNDDSNGVEAKIGIEISNFEDNTKVNFTAIGGNEAVKIKLNSSLPSDTDWASILIKIPQ